MAATLTEVATAAGVSVATASRAFKEPDRLAPETRLRVLAVAADLGYGTSSSASRTIGVIVPDISNAVFAALIKSVQNKAWHGRHRMILADANEEPARELELLTELTRGVDGVILCSPRLDPSVIQRAAETMPMVIINGEAGGTASVLMDIDDGIGQALEHLHALGHRRIAFVPGPASSWANAQRSDAMAKHCAAQDLDLRLVGNQEATVDGGLAAAASVVATGATAVVAFNDLVALGLQAGVRALGRRCPEDISIIGIDDLALAGVVDPGLTTVRVQIDRSGSMALERLLDQINGKSNGSGAIHLGSQLIVRGSTAVVGPSSGPGGL